MYGASDDTDAELRDAEARLQAFAKQTEHTHRLARLRRHRPRHPLLLALSALPVLTAGMMIAGLGLMAGVRLDPGFQRYMAEQAWLGVLPPALVLFSLCGLVLFVGVYGLAVNQGASSPRLPKALAQLNRLRSEVQRLKAAQKVKKRLSETPAPNRRVAYPGSR